MYHYFLLSNVAFKKVYIKRRTIFLDCFSSKKFSLQKFFHKLILPSEEPLLHLSTLAFLGGESVGQLHVVEPVPSHGRHNGFIGGRPGEQFRICSFRSSVYSNRNNPRTKLDCRLYRSSLLGCRFGLSGSSGFGFRGRLKIDFR